MKLQTVRLYDDPVVRPSSTNHQLRVELWAAVSPHIAWQHVYNLMRDGDFTTQSIDEYAWDETEVYPK